MKKNFMIALALVAGVSLSAADAAKKKKVIMAEPEVPVVAPVQLNNGSDSVSYAAGMAATQGLLEYLLQQKVDTAYMADFVSGFRETVSKNADDPKVKAYLMGTSIAQQLKERMLPGLSKEFQDTPDSIKAELFYKGFTDALLQDTTFFKVADAGAMVSVRAEAAKVARDEKLYGANRKAGEEFLRENAGKEGVITLPSGLQYKILTHGTGAVPSLNDKVQVHYEGRLIDGTVFDASKNHGDAPSEFRPTDVIKGWTEALTMMPVGSKWQLYIPAELAYGKRDAGKIKPYSTLVFDIELVGIVNDKPAVTKTTKTQKKTKK